MSVAYVGVQRNMVAEPVAVTVGELTHPVLGVYDLDPQQLEVAVLAIYEELGRAPDMVYLPGCNADELVDARLIATLNALVADGLIGAWGVRARTVKQAMRAMSFLGLQNVAVSPSELGDAAIAGLVASAKRARKQLSVVVESEVTPSLLKPVAKPA
ncbi:hypothetical protein QS713_01390 [Gleimia hominis]|uniref:Uncharacterized protein n=1 Tax=Gleimia hominis TaxID=595468 RepID=A0ABU3I8K3_9ACTO|nr:hypothetical protein [Gleimia hominis]MDT3766720.1 hypothetical protein [Gleimia hominis]